MFEFLVLLPEKKKLNTTSLHCAVQARSRDTQSQINWIIRTFRALSVNLIARFNERDEHSYLSSDNKMGGGKRHDETMTRTNG